MTVVSQSVAMALLNLFIRLPQVPAGNDGGSVLCRFSSLRCCCLTDDRLRPLKDSVCCCSSYTLRQHVNALADGGKQMAANGHWPSEGAERTGVAGCVNSMVVSVSAFCV